MNTLTKIILFSSPVLFFILFYVISSQKSLDTEIKKQDASFERSWNEFETGFAKDPETRKKYQARAEEVDKDYQELRKREKEREAHDAEFEKSMEKALTESEEKLKSKLR